MVRRLRADPLALVLCEVRFSPVLSIESHVPVIQEHLRKSGFPGFDRAVEHQFELVPSGPPRLTTHNRWIFRGVEKGQVVSLSTSAVNLQVVEYTKFEDFLEVLGPVIQSLADTAAPAFHDRIGIRYINAVENAGDRMSDFFHESVLSFSAEDLGVESLLTSQQLIGKTPRGQVVIRMNQVEDAPLLPPDLLGPVFPELARKRQGIHAILDIDGADMTRGRFALDDIEERLWDIHAYTELAFWRSTTDVAHREWGLEEVKVD